jgi:peptide deformylase
MKETMRHAIGVGLAAPQIGLLINLFVINTADMESEDKDGAVEQVFINAEILSYDGDNATYSEGCLSVPGIHENVVRKVTVTIRFMDEHFVEHIRTYDGTAARVIQHEYDHIRGKTFIDRLSPLKKTLLKRKLSDISVGKTVTFYRTKFIK